jgi:ribosome assembly protein SQT1
MEAIGENEIYQPGMTDGDDGGHDEQHPEEEIEINEEDILETIDCQQVEGEVEMEEDENEEMDEEMGEPHEQSEPPFDSSVTRFTKHQEPVFCLATHPCNPEVCASGGADDLGYIWNASTGQEILKLEGHRDSLSAIEFSRDGQYLATGGVDATIKIWKNIDPRAFSQWEFLMDLEGSEEVTVGSFPFKYLLRFFGTRFFL